jgi:hypothetical protein
MSVVLLTYSGELELGTPPVNGDLCDRCADRPAQIRITDQPDGIYMGIDTLALCADCVHRCVAITYLDDPASWPRT